MVPLLCLFTRRRLQPELRELVSPFTSSRLARGLLPATFFAAVLILPLHSLAVRGAPGGVSAALLATTPLFTLPLGLAFGIRPSGRTVLGTAIGFAGAVGTILSTS
jgi:drug/metabolite transporter (DMT)-like permease